MNIYISSTTISDWKHTTKNVKLRFTPTRSYKPSDSEEWIGAGLSEIIVPVTFNDVTEDDRDMVEAVIPLVVLPASDSTVSGKNLNFAYKADFIQGKREIAPFLIPVFDLPSELALDGTGEDEGKKVMTWDRVALYKGVIRPYRDDLLSLVTSQVISYLSGVDFTSAEELEEAISGIPSIDAGDGLYFEGEKMNVGVDSSMYVEENLVGVDYNKFVTGVIPLEEVTTSKIYTAPDNFISDSIQVFHNGLLLLKNIDYQVLPFNQIELYGDIQVDDTLILNYIKMSLEI